MTRIEDFKHIAVIQTAFLGDVALTLYLTQKIRNIHPSVEISFVTTPSASALVNCSTAIDNVITYDKRGLQSGLKGIQFIANILKEKNVDCVISPHRSLRTTLLSFLTKPKLSVSFNNSVLSILYSKRIYYKPHLHEVDRNLELLKIFNGNNNNIELPSVSLEFDDDVKSFMDYKLFSEGIKENNKIVLVAPGSIWNSKRWEEEYYTLLCNKLRNSGIKVILIGSKDDWELCSRISINSSVSNWAGLTSLPQTLVLMQKSDLTITNDSAPSHFAELSDCPVITIFGPTSPKFGFAPRSEKSKVIEISDLKCRPCSIHGSNSCPTKTHACMLHINPKIVYDAAKDILKI